MLMTNQEMEEVLQKYNFWKEAAMISIPRYRKQILDQELAEEVEKLGAKILFILEDYAQRNRGKSPI
jgi:hypothetical protein